MTQPVPEPLRSMLDDPRHDSLDGHCYEGCPCLPDRDYSLTYTLGARANKSRKRLDLLTRLELAAVIIILLGILCL